MSIEEIRRLVEVSEGLQFQGRHRAEVYGSVEQDLVGQAYRAQGKTARSLLWRYMEKTMGLSRAQLTRRIARYMARGGCGGERVSATSVRHPAHARGCRSVWPGSMRRMEP